MTNDSLKFTRQNYRARCWIFLLAVILGPGSALADSFRCNNSLVKRGDTAFDVREMCGSPDWENTRYREVFRGDPDGFHVRDLITVDEWIYKGRSGRFDRELIFYDGRLHRINLGERR